MSERELWRGCAAHVRELALKPLAERLGYRRDPRNRRRWKHPGSVPALARVRFFDYGCGRGGGGATHLVMHAADCSFGAPVEFLEHHSSCRRPLPSRCRPCGPRPVTETASGT